MRKTVRTHVDHYCRRVKLKQRSALQTSRLAAADVATNSTARLPTRHSTAHSSKAGSAGNCSCVMFFVVMYMSTVSTRLP